MWPNRTILDLFGISVPIIQAPMAGAGGADLAVAAGKAGALASLPCAMLTPEKASDVIDSVRAEISGPINLNFFCHTPAGEQSTQDEQRQWQALLAPYYAELDLDPHIISSAPARAPFDEKMCQLVESKNPEVVSFHFGLPASPLLARVKATGATVISSATTVPEAIWLEQNGCDAIIAQGAEAGGHRGMFLTQQAASQPGTMALVPQVVDAVDIPVIAAGGIADGRGLIAAMALGACGVQIGTAYLFTPQATVSDLHRKALANSDAHETALTNLFSGRPARGIVNRIMREIGPINSGAPAFPTAGAALAPLRKAAEAANRSDFTSLWSGQSAKLGRNLDASELTTKIAEEAQTLLRRGLKPSAE